MKAIVTIKISKNLKHNSNKKKVGVCPLDKNFACTDVTGEHHSYIVEEDTIDDIINKAKIDYGHVTRVEVIEE